MSSIVALANAISNKKKMTIYYVDQNCNGRQALNIQYIYKKIVWMNDGKLFWSDEKRNNTKNIGKKINSRFLSPN